MDVQCPRCETVYDFDEKQLTPEGINVKCGQCGATFRMKGASQNLPQGHRWMIKHQNTGDILYFNNLTMLQKWIVERKVCKDDHISKTGERWKCLGEIGELSSFFKAVEAPLGENKTPRSEVFNRSNEFKAPTPKGSYSVQDPNNAEFHRDDDLEGVARTNIEESGLGTESAWKFGRLEAENYSDEFVFGDNDSSSPLPKPTEEDEEDILKEYAPHSNKRRLMWVAIFLLALIIGLLSYLLKPDWFSLHKEVVETNDTSEKEQKVALLSEKDITEQEPLTSDPDGNSAISDVVETTSPESETKESQPVVIEIKKDGTEKNPDDVSEKTEDVAKEQKPEKEKPKPASYSSLIRKGKKHLNKSQFRKGLDTYQKALNYRSNGVEALTGLGWCYVNLKSYDAAINYFKKALKVNPKYGDAYIGIGKAYQKKGNKAKAVDAYESYLRYNPKGRQARIARHQLEQLGN